MLADYYCNLVSIGLMRIWHSIILAQLLGDDVCVHVSSEIILAFYNTSYNIVLQNCLRIYNTTQENAYFIGAIWHRIASQHK